MDERSIAAIWRAFGATAPLRIGVKTAESEDVRVVPYPFALIGRDPRCDLVLEDEAVSRRHALLFVMEGRGFAIDLASREGTLWGDGARQSGWIEDARGLGIGGFQVSPEAPAPTNPAAGGPPRENPLVSWSIARKPGHDLLLEVLSPQTKMTRWRINRTLTLIGRAPECKMRLMDPSVSSIHCVLVCLPMGLWVIDLLGREGILVNDQKARFARMSDNDDLRVGRFLFRVRGEPPQTSSRTELEADAPRPARLPAVVARQGGPPASLGASEPRRFVPSVIGPSESDLEIPARSAANPDAYLVPIVDALRMLQQHDQSQHQQTMMMLQTIFAMHGEQIRDVRNQLDHILGVLGEMRSLPADPSWVDRLAIAARGATHAAPAQGRNSLGFSQFAAGLSDGPAPSWTSPQGPGTTSFPGTQSPPPATNTAMEAGWNPAAPTAPDPANPAEPAPEETPAEGGKEPFVQDPGINTLICARLDEIRRERMSLWEKLLDMVGGR